MDKKLILTVTRQEIQLCWLSGMKFEDIISLCPDNALVHQFVMTEFIRLESTMKSSRINFNSEGPLRLQ